MNHFQLDDISNELCAFVSKNIVDQDIEVNANNSFASMEVDSFALIQVILFIERRFNVSIPEEELIPDNFTSIQTLSECTHKHLVMINKPV